VIDRHSNAISAFNIIESLQFFEFTVKEGLQNLPDVVPFLRLRIVATWISDEDDRGKEHDFETRLQLPGENEWKVIHKGTFRWTTRNHRLITDIRGLDLDQGTLLIVSAVRRSDSSSEWITQQYEIAVESTAPAKAD